MRKKRRQGQLTPRAGKHQVISGSVFLLLIMMALLAAGCVPTAEAPTKPITSTSEPRAGTLPGASPTQGSLPTVPAVSTSTGLHLSPTPSAVPTTTAQPTSTVDALPSSTAIATPDLVAMLTPTPVPTAALVKDVVRILLIGADSGSYAPDQNTDVLIVASVNRHTKQVSLLSIPRDLWAYIPTVGYSRINTAHRYGIRRKYPGGGPALLMRTIQENIGISVDHWVRVDYQGFAGAVDELGGIDLLVPCRTNLSYKPLASETEQEMILEPGSYHMDGATALRYVRTRRGESDFSRAHRQQQFLKGVWEQFRGADVIARLPGLWSAMSGNFRTDLNLADILALAPVVLSLQRQDIHSRYIGRSETQSWTTPEGWEVLLPIPDRIQHAVAGLDSAKSADEDGAATEAARIRVSNGTPHTYRAEVAADLLRWNGLSVSETGQADNTDYARTQIVVFQDKPETLGQLVQLFKVKPENVIQHLDSSQPVDLQLILGEDYDPCS